MFSGIIEAIATVEQAEATSETCRVLIARPDSFDDIKAGDSIATNGVCLTVEEFTDKFIQFCIGLETLQITGWSQQSLQELPVNLERSLRFGDRVHGHFVTGHVDTMGKIISLEKGENWLVEVAIDNFNKQLAWKKGSVSINGISLTINEVTNVGVKVCLIPETVHRTNFQFLEVGNQVTVEYDTWAKAFVNYQNEKRDVEA